MQSLYRALILSVFKSLLTHFMERESLNYIFIAILFHFP